MPLKIAMIGAGSMGFTRRLIQDILAVPEFRETEFALMDISEQNLQMVTDLCRRDIEANQLPAQLFSTTERREALADADYIFCTMRHGGLRALEIDLTLPLKYGIDQVVGDTLCVGGIMYAQRMIPELLAICAEIRELSRPDALLLNYANPMAMNTWACIRYGQVPTIGLCHGVQGSHWQITRCIQLWAQKEGLLAPDEKLHRREVEVVAAGINHQTWFIKVEWRGMDMIPHLYEAFNLHPYYPQTEKIRIDMLKRFGYWTTESNGHISEYLPWYRKRPEEIERWIDTSSWINGESLGLLRAIHEDRRWFEHEYQDWMQSPPARIKAESRSEEHGSYIIEALETSRVYRGHFNVLNQGHITNLPQGSVIEIPGYVDKTGIQMPIVGKLPLACAATCSASIHVQEMAMEAAVHGDVSLLKQAILHDPLTAAVCNPEEVWQMADELLVAEAEWLPQYADAIPEARQRLAEAEANGSRVKPRDWQGAVRIPERSLEALRIAKTQEDEYSKIRKKLFAN